MFEVLESGFVAGVPFELVEAISALSRARKAGGIDPQGNVYLFDGKTLHLSREGIKPIVQHLYNRGDIRFSGEDAKGRIVPLPLPMAQARIVQVTQFITAESGTLRKMLLPFDLAVRLPQVKLGPGDTFTQEEEGLRGGVWYVEHPAGTADVNPEYPHLKALFSGVTFADPAMHGNILGWYVAVFARAYCEQFPYLMIDAPEQDSGKTTVAEGLCQAIVRGGVSGTSLDSTGEAHGTTFATEAGKPGPVPFLLDNLGETGRRNRTLRSPLLAQMATGRSVQLRRKYAADRAAIAYPVCVLTMNQATLSIDLSSRVVHVRVQNGNCTRVTPYPPTYAKEHFEELQAEAIHLLTTHAFPQDDRTRFFNFHRVAAGAAKVLGLPYNFDPAAFSTTNAMVLELYSVIRGEHDGVSLRSLVATLHDRDRDLAETRAYVESQHARSTAGEILVLAGLIQKYETKEWRLDGRTFRFILEDAIELRVRIKEIA